MVKLIDELDMRSLPKLECDLGPEESQKARVAVVVNFARALDLRRSGNDAQAGGKPRRDCQPLARRDRRTPWQTAMLGDELQE